MKDKYWLMGPIYDALSYLFAGNSLLKCKCSMLTPDNLKPGDKVLFAGVGHGKEAILAAEQGAEVTVVDLSEAMLTKFKEGVAKSKQDLNITIIHSDIMAFENVNHYDMVVANFFLNSFDEPFMNAVFKHLIKQGKPGANIVVGDFAYPEGNIFARVTKRVYWYSAIIIFWLTTGAAVHPVYNHVAQMKKMGLKFIDKKHSTLLGMNTYTSYLGRKVR
ncbi:class I SAM-dependent methyltransferase [Alkalimarinus alittae]|uniref:Class I SAM-dependent methyltransferase n=1 Tax=Alkalimarinus alittae TaxID=2961619 RepID=A0ABY6N3T5_9ALTE|nr:class I SAM-dependent methyltransferase [Alkalimarinus alittae]UZE96652.1 class I SAM-dependent methyltransferase [Alkalimarinus alittae]